MKAMRRKPPRQFKLNGASCQVNVSGAAQAARCLEYTAEFHPNVEPNRPHNAVVFEWREDWGDLAPVTGLLAQLR